MGAQKREGIFNEELQDRARWAVNQAAPAISFLPSCELFATWQKVLGTLTQLT